MRPLWTLARILISAVLSVIVGIGLLLADVEWSPGGLAIQYLVRPEGLKDLGVTMLVGGFVNAVPLFVGFYWLLGRLRRRVGE